MPKLWKSGVGAVCAIAHYRASLFLYGFVCKCYDFGYNLETYRFETREAGKKKQNDSQPRSFQYKLLLLQYITSKYQEEKILFIK